MKSVSTAEWKAHMGKYLRLVRAGEPLQITSHRHAVARVMPIERHEELQYIEPTRPMKDLRAAKGIQPREGLDGVSALIRDRRRR
jgi:prevent-host-death family protein